LVFNVTRYPDDIEPQEQKAYDWWIGPTGPQNNEKVDSVDCPSFTAK
jgi:hypothetical protein